MNISSNPKVSIIMSVYNAEDFLRKSLVSLESQTYENIEYIICNDCSNDSSQLIIDEFIKNSTREWIVVKNEINIGLAASLNKCINLSSGDFIARHDADDIAFEQRISVQVKLLLENSDFGFVGSNALLMDDTDLVYGERTMIKYPTKNNLVKGSTFIHPSIMIRSQVFSKVKYPEYWFTRRGQDYYLWMNLYSVGVKGFNHCEPLMKFRESENSYKRKKVSVRMSEVVLRHKGYKLMKINFIKRIYVLKPIVLILLPNTLIKKYHKAKSTR